MVQALTLSDINYIGGCFTDPESCSSANGGRAAGLAGRRHAAAQQQQQHPKQQPKQPKA
jgi:hypothetical protein